MTGSYSLFEHAVKTRILTCTAAGAIQIVGVLCKLFIATILTSIAVIGLHLRDQLPCDGDTQESDDCKVLHIYVIVLLCTTAN
jgi:hypothetical protein